MKQFTLNPETAYVFEIDTTSSFAEYISGTANNLTGGLMTIDATPTEITIIGCNLDCEVIDNCLYIDDELMISFENKWVAPAMQLYE